jgi:hypothetical protein
MIQKIPIQYHVFCLHNNVKIKNFWPLFYGYLVCLPIAMQKEGRKVRIDDRGGGGGKDKLPE